LAFLSAYLIVAQLEVIVYENEQYSLLKICRLLLSRLYPS